MISAHDFFEEHPHMAERAAAVATALSGVTYVGATIAEVNQYLQAGAFVVAMISGLCAAVYYITKIRE
jgi:hypothetical protein